MTSLEAILCAAAGAPEERREQAWRVLQGEARAVDARSGRVLGEPLLTLRGLSRATGLGVSTLRRWQVPHVQLGSRPRYRLSEVEAYFKTEAFERRVAALRAERRHPQKQAAQSLDPHAISSPSPINPDTQLATES